MENYRSISYRTTSKRDLHALLAFSFFPDKNLLSEITNDEWKTIFEHIKEFKKLNKK